MLPGFDRIVEDRIRSAQRQGQFDNLTGAGQPLQLTDESGVADDLRMAHKILKNSDFLPPEIELKKQIRQTEELLAGMEDTKQRYRTMKKLNVMIMKLNSMRRVPVEMEMPQQYLDKVVQRLEQ